MTVQVLPAASSVETQGYEALNPTADTMISVWPTKMSRRLLRGTALVLFAQLIFWVLLAVGENLSRPAGLLSPSSVTLFLTDDWQLDGDEEPISVPLDDYPQYDYRDTSEAPSANRGVFKTQFDAGPNPSGLAIFFSSNYGLKEVRLNGRLIKAQSPTDPQGSLSGFGPLAFILPDEFVAPARNDLTVLSSGRTFKSLPQYFVGPSDIIVRAARWGRVFAIDLVVAATALMGFVALFCLLVNWPSGDRARINALIVLLLTWVFRNFSILGLFDSLPLPVLRIATYAASYLPLVAFVFFALAWCDYGKQLLKYRLPAYLGCVLIPIVLVVFDLRTLTIFGGLSLPWLLDNALTLLSMPLVIFLFAKYYSADDKAEGFEVLLFVVCASALLVDKLDNMFSLQVPFSDGLFLTFYSAPMCGLFLALGMTASIAAQATKARVAEKSLNRQLAEKLAASEEKIRRQARDSARLQERRRIMQDMHDGLGSRLSALVAEASDDQVPRSVLVDELVASIHELRLIVDSLDTEGDSLATALGSYRARIEPALEAAGINLLWKIEDVDSGSMSAEQVLEIFRILQAAIGNVIQHSDASTVTVALSSHTDGLCLVVCDDGCGFKNGISEGNGIPNMRDRARRLNGTLCVESDLRGVAVKLVIPNTQEKPH